MQRDYCEYKAFDIGQVVLVKAGREKGLFMVVVGTVDQNLIQLSDGHRRKLISPKIKKTKHVLKTNTIFTDIAAAINDGTVTDKSIKNALKAFCQEKKGNDSEQK